MIKFLLKEREMKLMILMLSQMNKLEKKVFNRIMNKRKIL